MAVDPTTLALLAAIVGLAYTAEAALGFGCNVLALTLAATLVPLESLLPVVVSLNLVVSTAILARHWRHVDRAALGRWILPWCGLGLPLGLATFLVTPPGLLTRAFGGFVLVLAVAEGVTQVRDHPRPVPTRAQTRLALAGAGFFHGLVASGGPLLVWWAGRVLPDKATFRATLTAVWLVLNLPLMAGYGWDGRLDAATGTSIAWLLVPTVGGIVVGEWLHGRLAERAFLGGVYVLLAIGGVVLLSG